MPKQLNYYFCVQLILFYLHVTHVYVLYWHVFTHGEFIIAHVKEHQSVEVSRKSTSSLPGLAVYSSSDSSESEDESSRDASH